MTPAEKLMQEREKILQERSFYITPFRMASLMAAASKITNMLIHADTNICYEECRIILSIVESSIQRVTEKDGSKE